MDITNAIDIKKYENKNIRIDDANVKLSRNSYLEFKSMFPLIVGLQSSVKNWRNAWTGDERLAVFRFLYEISRRRQWFQRWSREGEEVSSYLFSVAGYNYNRNIILLEESRVFEVFF